MTISAVYIFVTAGGESSRLAARFVATYHEHPPQAEHNTIVACNGGLPRIDQSLIFASLAPLIWARENDPGWDISAYIEAAHGPARSADMLLCFGESIHFHRAGWLTRLVEVWKKEGPGLYGFFSSNAFAPHLQTSAFATSPGILRSYATPLRGKKDRYEFEHGKRAFWRHVAAQGHPVRLVTWDGCWQPREWRRPENILWKGTQKNCLAWNNHAENWFKAEPLRRARWSARADQPFTR